jgi:2-C-methyl-D-erythritol 2,4-cyclodiphosphate synthase
MNIPRIGVGYDSHRLVEGRPLILGGLTIPHHKGLLGHSDADVLLHAIIDALLGAVAAGDIGYRFPDTDEKHRDASSIDMLVQTAEIVRSYGYEVSNVDAVVIAEEPRLSPYIQKIRGNIAFALGVDPSVVSVKGKTAEGMGSVGSGEGIAVHAVAIVAPT